MHTVMTNWILFKKSWNVFDPIDLLFMSVSECIHIHSDSCMKHTLRKKVEPKRLHPWSCFMVRNSAPPWHHFGKKRLHPPKWHRCQNGTRVGPFWLHFFFSVYNYIFPLTFAWRLGACTYIPWSLERATRKTPRCFVFTRLRGSVVNTKQLTMPCKVCPLPQGGHRNFMKLNVRNLWPTICLTL